MNPATRMYVTHAGHPGRVLKVIRQANNGRLYLCRIESGYPTNWVGEEVWLSALECAYLFAAEAEHLIRAQGAML